MEIQPNISSTKSVRKDQIHLVAQLDHLCIDQWLFMMIIGSEGALRLPATYDNHPIPSNPIRPSTKPLSSSKQALDRSKSTSNNGLQ